MAVKKETKKKKILVSNGEGQAVRKEPSKK